MENSLAPSEKQSYEIISNIVLAGDLSQLTPQQQVQYYNQFCNSLGLNPITRPFDIVDLKGKKVLYANKNCSEQLRQIHGVSFMEAKQEISNDIFIVTVKAQNKNGRIDTEIGAVAVKGLAGEALANAMMKAMTKAKRRATLSICSVGLLDETEIDSIPEAKKIDSTHEKNITPATPTETKPDDHKPQSSSAGTTKFSISESVRGQILDMMREMDWPEKRQTLVFQKAEMVSGEKVALDAITGEYQKFLATRAHEEGAL